MNSRDLITPLMLLVSLTVFAQNDSSSTKEPVTLEIDSQLMNRARDLNMDLSAFLERQLAQALDVSMTESEQSHLGLVTQAFDDFELMMFTPIGIDASSSGEEVQAKCAVVSQQVSKLKAYGKARQVMGSPGSLTEIASLNEYLGNRYQALQGRMAELGGQLQSSGKIMEEACPQLNAQALRMETLVQDSIGMYTPQGWCQAMQKKPRAEWTMDDSTAFVRFCTGG